MTLRKFFTGFIFFALLLSSTQATQTCISTPINGQDVNALSGSSDTNIIAVADNANNSGQIIIFDGTNWVLQTDPDIPNEDFNDVFVFDANNAVVVGDDGAVVLQVNGDWIDISISNQDYTTIWAYANDDIFIAGDNGRIYHYDGSNWSSNLGSGSNNDDFVDSWGDATYVYFLNDDGDVFRYTRSPLQLDPSLSPNPINPGCPGNIDYNGFINDGAGNFYLFGENQTPNPDEGVIFKWDGVNDSCGASVFNTSSTDDINAISINPDGTFTAVGDDGVVVTSPDGITWTEISSGGEDINAIYTLSNGSSIFGADNGNNQICTDITPHFSIIHDGFSSTCAAEAIKIRFHDTNHAIGTNYTGTINISTSSGNGTWALIAGSNTASFTDNGNGSASYTFVAGDNDEITLSLANTSAEILNINISDGTYTEFLTEDNNLTFSGGAATATFSDDFSSNTYSNNTGSNLWTNDWTESNDDGLSGNGDLTATTGYFRLEGNDDDGGDAIIKSLSRSVNLTTIGATAATLQFKYQRQSLERINDRVFLETSTDGGATWTELDRFQGSGASLNDSAFVTSPVYNLAISATTQIRFRNDVGMDTGDFVYFDDVTITATGIPSPCSALNHIRIIHDGEGLTCDKELVTIKACIDADCTTEYTAGTVSLNLTPDGDTVTFTGNTPAYVRQSTVGLATLAATITSTPAPTSTPPVRCFNGATESCNMNFVNSGFRFTDGANPPNLITIGTQIAGKASNINPGAQTIALQAVRTDTNTGACVGAFADGSDVNVEIASQCNNPTTCIAASKVNITNNVTTTSINNNPNTGVSSYSPVLLRFTTNSQAILNFAYPDVGQISLHARYNIPDNTGTPTGNYMSGSSNLFVVKPATFIVTNILRADDTANPANTTATDTPYFVKASTDFKATIEAHDINGNITPNYGNEIIAEGVLLTPSLVAGLGLTNNPVITNNTIAGTEFGSTGAVNDADGVASVINLSWHEVGIITITPSVADNDYLGTGIVTGTATGNVGRFVPHHFDTVATNGCSATFTYSGQPFTVQTKAMNNLATPTVTQNYHNGSFAQAVTLSTTSSIAGSFIGTGNILATDFTNGSYIKSDVAYTYTNKNSIPDTSFLIRATDTDNVSSDDPAANEGTIEIRSGRMRLENVYGSELTALTMPLSIEYYSDNTLIADPSDDGYILNTDDSCTTYDATLGALTNYTGNLSTGETTVTGAGSVSAGLANIIFSAPGAGNDGSVNLLANNVSNWLTYNWNVDCDNADADDDITTGIDAGTCGPFGTASFGLYRGDDRIIYWREVF